MSVLSKSPVCRIEYFISYFLILCAALWKKGEKKQFVFFFFLSVTRACAKKKNWRSGYWRMSAREIVYFIWHLIRTEGRVGFMGRGHLQSSSEPNIYYAGWKLAVDLSRAVVRCRLDSAPVLVLHVTAIIYRHFKYEHHPPLVVRYKTSEKKTFLLFYILFRLL